MKIIVAITGASGAVMALRLLQELSAHHVYLVVTAAARRVIRYELGDPVLPCARCFAAQEMDASIASSSHPVDAMVVIPCSMKTLAAIAHGYTDDLVVRAADNVLRMNKRLVLVPRETPLSLAALENMRVARQAGAVILPPAMAYYFQPQTVDDVTDFFVGKVLDALGLPHELYRRWSGPETGEE
ncbi:MAG: UbiX family flavin prenyltransferase [Anaerolineae bacterium]|nr:UbiX family flavin prenyltransferase [Anaerolineae bacterium]